MRVKPPPETSRMADMSQTVENVMYNIREMSPADVVQ